MKKVIKIMGYNTGDKYLELVLFPDRSVMVYDIIANSAIDEIIGKLGYTIAYNKIHKKLSYVNDGDKEKWLEIVALYEEMFSRTLCKHCNKETDILGKKTFSDDWYFGCKACNKLYIYKKESLTGKIISFTEVLDSNFEKYNSKIEFINSILRKE